MKTERLSQILFLAAAAVALLVYSLSAPSSLPWGLEAKMAAALAADEGGVSAAWRFWGYFVEMFAGHFVALACVAAAVSAGLLALTVNRYLGWRVATAAALVWTFFPGVWNGTALGTCGVCVASGIVILLWWVHRQVRLYLRWETDESATGESKHAVLLRRIAWGTLGAAGVFALVSALAHDWQLGEPAGVYARGVVREAGDRIVVLNGVADEQVLEELRMVNGKWKMGWENGVLSSISSERGYRPKRFTAQVKAEWPEQTNYWVAAEIGPGVFLREASKEYGANFYRMDGRDSTLEGWEKRWDEAKAYLQSDDPFVPVMRRVFAYEGNGIANAMQESTSTSHFDSSTAWQLYKRIYDEIDPGNFAALINQCEMIRRGYTVSEEERQRVNRQMDEFFADPVRRKRARKIARSSGPVRSDPELIARLEKEARQRVSEKVAKGELTELPKSWMTLIEWNNEMIASVGRGDREKATSIARAILSNEQWGGFIPANAILGTATAVQGDYAAAEVFFQKATATTNAVPAVVLNDYAHVLMCLGKLEEAEKTARRAVETDKNLRIARRTLGEILEKRCQAKGGRE